MAYNSSRHSTTGVSPYKAVFGQEPRLPSDGSGAVAVVDDLPDEDFRCLLQQRNRNRQMLHARMMEKIKKAQENMIRLHHRRNSAPEFKVGDKVLLRNKKRDDRKGGKLETTWSATVYRIEIVKGRNTYNLANPEGIRLRKQVNGCHLKKYIE